MSISSPASLNKKTKKELITIIQQLSQPKEEEIKDPLENGQVHFSLRNSRLPSLILNTEDLEVIYQNDAAKKVEFPIQSMVESLKQKLEIKKNLSEPLQWSYKPDISSGEDFNLFVEEIYVSQRKYLLLRLFRTVSELKSIDQKPHPKINFYKKELMVRILRMMKTGIMYHDLTEELTYINESYHRLLDLPYKEDPYSLHETSKWIHPDDANSFSKVKETINLVKETVEFEARIVSPITQKVTNVLIRYTPEIKQGKVIGIWGANIDIRFIKELDRQVRTQETLFYSLNKNFLRRNDVLETIENTTKIAWWYLDRDTNQSDYSANWQDFYNIERAQFHYLETYLAIIHPADKEEFERFVERSLGGEPYAACTYRLVNFESTKYIYSVNITKGKNLYGYVQDITDLRQMESNLQMIEQRYKEVVNTQEEMIARFKPDSTLTFVNETYARFFGKTVNEITGTKFLQYISPDKHPYIIQNLKKVAQYGKKHVNINQTLEKNKKKYWFRWTDYPLFDDDGKLVEFQTSGIDITEQIIAERKLKESEEKHKMLAEATNDVIYWLDKDMKLSYVNSAINVLLGYSKEEFLNISHDKIIAEEYIEKVRKVVLTRKEKEKQGKGDNKTRTWYLPLIHKSGKKIWGEIVTTPIRDSEGRFSGIVGIIRDISIRKKYENRLVTANQELKGLIEDKNKFLSMVSHDLKSPLNSLLGMVYMLKNDLSPVPKEEILNTLDFSARHLKSLVNNLLDLASLKNHKLTLDRKSFDLSELLYNCCSAFTLQALDKSINFEFTHQNIEQISPIGDPDRITQIINNLLSNAFKFTEEGSVHLHASFEEDKSGTGKLRLSVEDSGPGIDEANMLKIFQPFTKIHPNHKEGSGIGLAIVKELVALHQGTVTVDSEYGEGTIFRVEFSLPYQLSVKEKEQKPQPSIAESLSGLSVLYVEDLEYNQKLMYAYSQLWHFDLFMANDAETGIELITSNSFDLVLMDILLPGITGHKASRMIRQYEAKKRVKDKNTLIAVTADESQPINWYRKKGFDDVIYKPFDPARLQEKLLYWGANRKVDQVQGSMERGKLFYNLKSTFTGRPESLIQVISSFAKDLIHQKENFLIALEQQDSNLYKKARHNSLAMLSMMNEQKLLEFLNTCQDLPEDQSGKASAKKIIVNQIDSLQRIINLEVEKLKKQGSQ